MYSHAVRDSQRVLPQQAIQPIITRTLCYQRAISVNSFRRARVIWKYYSRIFGLTRAIGACRFAHKYLKDHLLANESTARLGTVYFKMNKRIAHTLWKLETYINTMLLTVPVFIFLRGMCILFPTLLTQDYQWKYLFIKTTLLWIIFIYLFMCSENTIQYFWN